MSQHALLAVLARRLDEISASGQTVTYGDLARQLGLRMGALTEGLELLMEQDAATPRPLRAALCEGRLNDGLPARGFFDKAVELGYDVSDPAGFAAGHRHALWQWA